MSSPLPHAQHDDNNKGNIVPHYYKLSFPMFDSKDDLLGWLNRCEHFLCAQCTHEADKVCLATFHMTGAAQHWYYMLERDTRDVSRQLFNVMCHQCFGPVVGINHLVDLSRLQLVAPSLRVFRAKKAHVGYLSPAKKAHVGYLSQINKFTCSRAAYPKSFESMLSSKCHETYNAPWHWLGLMNSAPPHYPPLPRAGITRGR
jgi:hypothetical protein